MVGVGRRRMRRWKWAPVKRSDTLRSDMKLQFENDIMVLLADYIVQAIDERSIIVKHVTDQT